MPTVLITGANRGLGLEFALQYAADGWRVHACCRNPSTASDLAELAGSAKGQVVVHRLDPGAEEPRAWSLEETLEEALNGRHRSDRSHRGYARTSSRWTATRIRTARRDWVRSAPARD